MADVEFGQLRNGGNRLDIVEGQAMAGMRLDTVLDRQRRHVGNALQFDGPGLANGMGMWGTQHAAVSVPVMFLTAEKDVFARTTGRPYAAFARVEGPKYQVMVKRGAHVWFHDGYDAAPADHKNPDCLWFEKYIPGMVMPGCEERVPLIGAARQQELSRAALHDFFDGYLKQDAKALGRLKAMGRITKDVDVRWDEK